PGCGLLTAARLELASDSAHDSGGAAAARRPGAVYAVPVVALRHAVRLYDRAAALEEPAQPAVGDPERAVQPDLLVWQLADGRLPGYLLARLYRPDDRGAAAPAAAV